MEFRLLYKGKLGSNKDARAKMAIRKIFHPQLKNLWEKSPLKEWVETDPKLIETNFLENIGVHQFIPLVTDKLHLYCELDILFLRQEKPGSLYVGGDIDNRIKTLFDALSIPNQSQLSSLGGNIDIENPFYCLLKDDALITRVNVETDQLFMDESSNMVRLIIRVKVRATKQSWLSSGLGMF